MDSGDWDRRYADAQRPFGATPNATVVDQIARLGPGTALDLACGDGRHAAWLASRGWSVDAVDFSPVAIDEARTAWSDQRDAIGWHVGDAREWSPERRYDLVLIAYFQSEELALALDRARTWLAPRGRLVYLGHARENLAYGVGGPSAPEVLPTVAGLAHALDGMEILQLRHVVRATAEGDACDVLAVAREFED